MQIKRIPTMLLCASMLFGCLTGCTEATFPERGTSEADQSYLQSVEAQIEEIRSTQTNVTYTGTAYYVSCEGSDENDGLSPETAWASVAPVNGSDLQPGDAVFFRRGDIFRGHVFCKEGVTYSAYGEGEKPRLYASPESGADAEKWSLWYEAEGIKIWKYHRSMQDCGGIVFDDGAEYASRVFAYWDGEKAVVPSDHSEDFDLLSALKHDLQFYCGYPETMEEIPFPAFDADLHGELYLRCDRGNPGDLYTEIEFQCPENPEGYAGILQCGDADNIVIDNLCVMYSNTMAIASGGNNNITVQNCEAAFVGGGSHIIGYTDPYTPSACIPVSGEGIRLDGHNNKAIHNYVHDCFDGGIIFEPDLSFELSDGVIDDATAAKKWGQITIEGNVIERCMSGVLIGVHCEDSIIPQVEGITICDNDILFCGYGWSSDEHYDFTWRSEDYDGNAITFWYDDYAHEPFLVENNRLYVAKSSLIRYAYSKENQPVFRGNTYAQEAAGYILRGSATLRNASAEKLLTSCHEILGDAMAKVF